MNCTGTDTSTETAALTCIWCVGSVCVLSLIKRKRERENNWALQHQREKNRERQRQCITISIKNELEQHPQGLTIQCGPKYSSLILVNRDCYFNDILLSVSSVLKEQFTPEINNTFLFLATSIGSVYLTQTYLPFHKYNGTRLHCKNIETKKHSTTTSLSCESAASQAIRSKQTFPGLCDWVPALEACACDRVEC